jgi:hypothetical protein
VIGTFGYLTPTQKLDAVETYNYGTYFDQSATGNGRHYRDVILSRPEPSLYKLPFGEDFCFIIYPEGVAKKATPISMGPMFLPVIPMWFLVPDRLMTNRTDSVSIAWFGKTNLVDHITVTHVFSGIRSTGELHILGPRGDSMECRYLFKEELTDASVLLLDYSDGHVSLPVPLTYERGWLVAPYIGLLGNTIHHTNSTTKVQSK